MAKGSGQGFRTASVQLPDDFWQWLRVVSQEYGNDSASWTLRMLVDEARKNRWRPGQPLRPITGEKVPA